MILWLLCQLKYLVSCLRSLLIPLFFHCPGCLIFSTLLATMYFHFVLVFLFLLHLDLNHLIISFSYHHGDLLSGHFRPLNNYIGPPVNLVTWEFCFWYFMSMSFTSPCSWITLFQIFSCNDIQHGSPLMLYFKSNLVMIHCGNGL